MDYRRQLGAATTDTVNAVGNYVYVKSASYAVVIEVNGRRESCEAGQGIRLRGGEKFSSFDATSASAQAVVFYVGLDEFVDKRISGSVDSLAVRSTSLNGAAALGLVDTDTGTIAVNSEGQRVLVKNKRGSVGTIWINHDGAINKGIPLDAGECIPLDDFVGDIAYYCEGGAATLCLLEVRR